MTPLSPIPSISNAASRCCICVTISGRTIPSRYMISTFVPVRLPHLHSATFRSTERSRFRISAVFCLMESPNPSLLPRMAFSDSVFCKDMPGYPLSGIFSARSNPSTNRIESPVSIPPAASDICAKGVTSETPSPFSCSTAYTCCGSITFSRFSILPSTESSIIFFPPVTSI